MSERNLGLEEIARVFLKIGAMSYGGPAIMGIMQTEIQTDLPARSRAVRRLSPASTSAVKPRAISARVLARGGARHSARSDDGTLSVAGRDCHTSIRGLSLRGSPRLGAVRRALVRHRHRRAGDGDFHRRF